MMRLLVEAKGRDSGGQVKGYERRRRGSNGVNGHEREKRVSEGDIAWLVIPPSI